MPAYRRTRPFWRTMIDAFVFAAALWMVALILDFFGVTAIVPGHYYAVDGDSLRRGSLDVRLYGIDAPELHQTCNDGQGQEYNCGQNAKDALTELVRGKTVNCRGHNLDKYGRTLATCRADGIDINTEMVRLGWAIAYADHGFAYVLAERDARKNQRGIWWGDFEQPRDYRASHRVNKSDIAGLEQLDD